jgi:hypothetical protein
MSYSLPSISFGRQSLVSPQRSQLIMAPHVTVVVASLAGSQPEDARRFHCTLRKRIKGR